MLESVLNNHCPPERTGPSGRGAGRRAPVAMERAYRFLCDIDWSEESSDMPELEQSGRLTQRFSRQANLFSTRDWASPSARLVEASQNIHLPLPG